MYLMQLWYLLGDEQFRDLHSDERNYLEINCMLEQLKAEDYCKMTRGGR